MKKIIVAFDGLNFSESAMQYGLFLARGARAQLTGIFLKEATGLGYALYESMVGQSVPGRAMVKEIAASDNRATDEAVARFEMNCREAGVTHRVHRDLQDPAVELIHESRFADLLVVDMWETFSYLESGLPGWFIKTILQEAACPVIIVPRRFTPVKKLALLYDGSPSSMQAIRMLNYVLPQFQHCSTTLWHAAEDLTGKQLPDQALVTEWLESHYPKVSYKLVRGAEKEIISMLKQEQPGTLAVAGAYHRSRVSMWFHKSMADLLMKDIAVPIFIAHT
ncbi:MAG TPA: universal stress protein [Puia sp.]|nr:universal stress protein [Puia sp.]